MSDILQALGQLNQFKQAFKGNAQQQVQEALQNANISNEEYQKLVNDANQLYALAKQFGIVK